MQHRVQHQRGKTIKKSSLVAASISDFHFLSQRPTRNPVQWTNFRSGDYFLKACYAFNLCIFQAMLDFLLVARKPLVHLGSRADLLNLRANHGGRVLVGYFPDLFASLKSRKVWRKFLDASYTFLEQDPFQNSIGGMGVVTSQNVALTLQLDASRPIR